MSKAIGILGGTFDPIHLGHLHLASQVYKQLDLQELRFIPCYQSPFKKRPIATDEQRLTMLKLALKNHSEFIIDDRELQRKKISYTIDIVKSLHQEFANMPLYLIMSADAFSKFNLWRDWQEIAQLANLVVADRPGSKSCLLLDSRVRGNDENVLFIKIDPLPISATKIRALIKEGKNASSLLPKSVWEFINQNKIYQRK
jgi:nicotinate-nucleotide adenylyltransferase